MTIKSVANNFGLKFDGKKWARFSGAWLQGSLYHTSEPKRLLCLAKCDRYWPGITVVSVPESDLGQQL